jgi:hypothetical protein
MARNKRSATPVERWKVEFRTEFHNLFNHTNYDLPSTTGGAQGAAPSSGGQIASTFTPRVIQFGLKILH